MPRGPGTVLFYLCPTCRHPRRYLYRLSLSLTGLVDYFGLQCQRCAGLRFRSQGRYRYPLLRWMLRQSGESFRGGRGIPAPCPIRGSLLRVRRAR